MEFPIVSSSWFVCTAAAEYFPKIRRHNHKTRSTEQTHCINDNPFHTIPRNVRFKHTNSARYHSTWSNGSVVSNTPVFKNISVGLYAKIYVMNSQEPYRSALVGLRRPILFDWALETGASKNGPGISAERTTDDVRRNLVSLLDGNVIIYSGLLNQQK